MMVHYKGEKYESAEALVKMFHEDLMKRLATAEKANARYRERIRAERDAKAAASKQLRPIDIFDADQVVHSVDDSQNEAGSQYKVVYGEIVRIDGEELDDSAIPGEDSEDQCNESEQEECDLVGSELLGNLEEEDIAA